MKKIIIISAIVVVSAIILYFVYKKYFGVLATSEAVGKKLANSATETINVKAGAMATKIMSQGELDDFEEFSTNAKLAYLKSKGITGQLDVNNWLKGSEGEKMEKDILNVYLAKRSTGVNHAAAMKTAQDYTYTKYATKAQIDEYYA